jgi:hypothetical protein
MLIGELREKLSTFPDARVLINLGIGPYHSPDTISERLGKKDVIIDPVYPRTDVKAGDLLGLLDGKSPDGKVEVYKNNERGEIIGYYNVVQVSRRTTEQVVLVCIERER